jgi:hypothetical protein
VSERDEPTEPAAPADRQAEPTQPPVPGGEEAEPTERPSLFAAVTGRRAAIALVIVGLVWLGVWAYSSDSAATSSSATTASVASPASSPARKKPRHDDRGRASPTTLAPPAGLARTPEAYATALFGDWMRHDRPAALRVGTTKAVNRLFARRPVANEHFTAGGCTAAGSFSNCIWTSTRREIVMQVQNPAGSTPVRVIGVTIHRL